MADRRRSHDNLCEVALWADMLRAIRALTGSVRDTGESIARTNAALGIGPKLI